MTSNFPAVLKPLLIPIRMDTLGFFFINFIIPVVAHQRFDANGWEMGILFSLQAVGTGLSALIFSKRVNRWANRATFALVACVLKAAAYVCLYLAILESSYTVMIFATLALGFGSGLFWLVWQTCFGQVSDFKHRAEVLGEASKQLGIGVMWGAIFAFTLLSVAEGEGYSAAIIYASIPVFAVASLYAGIKSYYAIRGIVVEEYSEEVVSKEKIRMSKLTLCLFGLVFVGQLTGSLVAPFLEVYLLEHLNIVSVAELSIAYIPGGIISMMAAPMLGRFADRVNPAIFLSFASVVGATSTWLMLQVSALWQISVLFVIDASVITTSALVLSKLISEVAGENKGSAFGVQGFVSNFGAISGPLVGGIFWQVKGSTGPLMFSISTEVVLAICCLTILLPLLRSSRSFSKLITSN
ncbi:MFS transporter [Vibrio sp. Of7-15]|uniref:MFS transporter n=1 Tax=Vibrio sp. Of7-15 TaxID=2724879 RepID=UPI001EF223C2|nr:MFS transporter [Vibrio sp. Of7-15]MCG7495640.1 MFS transporter [Vibrio sp. Of7-15]